METKLLVIMGFFITAIILFRKFVLKPTVKDLYKAVSERFK